MSSVKPIDRDVITQLVVEAITESMSAGTEDQLSKQSRDILEVVRPHKPLLDSTTVDIHRFIDEAYEKGLDMDDVTVSTALGARISIDIDHFIDASKVVSENLANAKNDEFGAAYDVYMVKPTDLDITGPKSTTSQMLETYHEVCFHGSSAWEPGNFEHYERVTSSYRSPGHTDNQSLSAVYDRLQNHGMNFRRLSTGDLIHDLDKNIHYMIEPGVNNFTPVATNLSAYIVYAFPIDAKSNERIDKLFEYGAAAWNPTDICQMLPVRGFDRENVGGLNELLINMETNEAVPAGHDTGIVVHQVESGDHHLLTSKGFEPIEVEHAKLEAGNDLTEDDVATNELGMRP